jgi:hypothetical protein
MSRELDPIDVLSDLLGEEGFEIADTRLAAVIILQRLRAAGFSVVLAEPAPLVADDGLAAGMNEILRLRAEIDRLQKAKRRALQLAEERAKEANALRIELDTRGGKT